MNDPEFRQMMKTFFIILIITLLFLIPLYFIFQNKIIGKESNILSNIRKNKTIVIYITENKCSNCNEIRKELQKNKVNYKELNKNSKDYNKIISILEMKDSNIYTPTLMYVKKGKLYSYIVNIEEKEEVEKFIKKFKLSK